MRKNLSRLAWLMTSLLTIGVSACGGSNSDSPGSGGTAGPIDQDFARLGLKIEIDPSMTPPDQERVKADYVALSRFKVDGSVSPYFRPIFGGNTQTDTITYIDERINYIVPNRTDIDSRLVIATTDRDNDPRIVATNIGTALWLVSEGRRPRTFGFRFADSVVPIDSSRVGIIMLGGGYSERLDTVDRIGTQIHEARHSDCTGGLNESDLSLILSGEAPKNPGCGHLHVECPVGHPYAGLFACDQHGWGAYSVQAVFYAVLSESCGNCNETQRQLAIIAGNDAVSRVLVLEEMISGRLGPPDMSSGGLASR